MTKFDYQYIDEYQIEITTYCNAACPQCPRNLNGGIVNPYMPLTHLEAAVIDRAFDADLCQRLRQVFFCGSYGDPIMHPHFLQILRDFRRKNPKLWLYFHTNGGVHEADWWQEVAEIMAGYGQVDFGIDGLEDTLGIYRRGVSFDRVIGNARAFIQAGGRAQWNFIVFQHNEHQVVEAKTIAQDIGFIKFLPRRTGRFFHHGQEKELEEWPIHNRKGDVIAWLRPPRHPQWRNSSLQRLPMLQQRTGNLQHYFSSTIISCDALTGKKVAISAEGLVMPCNFFTHNLYDARFYSDALPGRNRLHDQDNSNQIRAFLESYGLDNLNIRYKSLEEIFLNRMWQDLVESWQKPLGQGRLFECAMTCGQEFTKVWDQGGNNR